jgi:hypothetical protein
MTKKTYKNEPIEITETRESALIVAALGDIRAGTHASAEFFNQDLQEDSPARVSRQTVWHWANGSKCVSDARVRYWKLAFAETDVRHQLAVAILKVRESQISAHWIGQPASTSLSTSVLVPALTEVSTPTTQPKKRRMRLGRDF